jgi:hypothetical protein
MPALKKWSFRSSLVFLFSEWLQLIAPPVVSSQQTWTHRQHTLQRAVLREAFVPKKNRPVIM